MSEPLSVELYGMYVHVFVHSGIGFYFNEGLIK